MRAGTRAGQVENMPSEDDIIKDIEHMVAIAGPYSVWTIGITADPGRRQRHRDSPHLWNDWYAETEMAAKRIESHFTDEGMKTDASEDKYSAYVYIF